MNKGKEQAVVLTPAQIKAYSVRRAIDFIATKTIAEFNLTKEQEKELNAQASLAQFSLHVSSPALDIELQRFINQSNNFRLTEQSAQTPKQQIPQTQSR